MLIYFRVTIPFNSNHLQWLFRIRFDIFKVDNIRSEDIEVIVLIHKKFSTREIKNLAKDKPAGYKFLRAYINSLEAYIKVMESKAQQELC